MYIKMLNTMANNISGMRFMRFDGLCYFLLGVIPSGDFEIELVARARSFSPISDFIAIGTSVHYGSHTNRFNITGGSLYGNMFVANAGGWENTRFRMENYVNRIVTYRLTKYSQEVDGVTYPLGGGDVGTYSYEMALGTTNIEGTGAGTGHYSTMDFFSLVCKRGGNIVAYFLPFADNQLIEKVSGAIITRHGNGIVKLMTEY